MSSIHVSGSGFFKQVKLQQDIHEVTNKFQHVKNKKIIFVSQGIINMFSNNSWCQLFKHMVFGVPTKHGCTMTSIKWA